MKLLQFVLIIFFLTSFSLAQSGWFKQKSGTKENLNSVFFTSTNNGIIAGANGTLLRTTDGGTNWVKLLSSTTNNLKKILFADSLSGIIIGDNGTIITTRDGGTTWNNPLNAIEYSFADLSFIDANNGIAVGTSFPNIIYKTTDGGLSWNRITELNIASFKPERIHQDDFNIVVIGLSYGYSEVYQSINDGKSWQLVFSGGGDGYTDAYFFDSKTGYLLTQSGSFAQYNSSVYKTTDGGKSWIVATPFSYRLPAFLLNKIRFVNETTGFIVGSKGVIYKTSNGGTTWTLQPIDQTYEFKDIFFSDPTNGTIIGEHGLILKTITSGEETKTKWESPFKNPFTTPPTLWNFSFTEKFNGIIAMSASPCILSDTGIDWKSSNSSYYNGDKYSNCFFLDSKIGSVVGVNGYILNSTDGGQNWSSITWAMGSEFEFMRWTTAKAIWYIDFSNRIVVGEYGAIIQTLDGGVSYIKRNSGTTVNLNDVCFKNSKIGFSVGDNGTIIQTKDGGLTWISLISRVTTKLNAIYFTDLNNGLIVGSSGVILKTNDGGTNWKLLASETERNLFNVSFGNKKNGLIVGELGLILRSTDGGENWTPEPSGSSATLYGVAIKDSVEIAVGEGGTFLKNISNSDTSVVDSDTTVVNSDIPTSFSLSQNYPNPFNPTTIIQYSIPTEGHVTLKVYDMIGREVEILVDEYKNTGVYNSQFSIDNSQLSSGVYFYRLQCGNFSETKKLVLMK